MTKWDRIGWDDFTILPEDSTRSSFKGRIKKRLRSLCNILLLFLLFNVNLHIMLNITFSFLASISLILLPLVFNYLPYIFTLCYCFSILFCTDVSITSLTLNSCYCIVHIKFFFSPLLFCCNLWLNSGTIIPLRINKALSYLILSCWLQSWSQCLVSLA